VTAITFKLTHDVKLKMILTSQSSEEAICSWRECPTYAKRAVEALPHTNGTVGGSTVEYRGDPDVACTSRMETYF